MLETFSRHAGDYEEWQASPGRQPPQRFDAGRILRGVDLGRDDDHGLAGEILAERGQLFDNDFEIVDRLAAGELGYIHQVRQQSGPLDVTKKLNAEALAQVSALDQTGNIGDDEAAKVFELYDA